MSTESKLMLDDFFTRAIMAGLGIALVAGPLGCFIVWRRLAYFGDTLAHAALLGVAIGFLLETNLTLTVFATSLILSLCLLFLQKNNRLPADALLGMLSHSALAIGIVVIAFLSWIRFDLTSLLFGDILAVSRMEIALIYAGTILILGLLVFIWKPLFAITVSRELSEAEGIQTSKLDIVFIILLSATIAVSLKIIGALLITALLIIPAITARNFASSPEQMMVAAMFFGMLAVLSGLFGSLQFDTPSGPSIVVAALVFFLISISPLKDMIKRKKRHAD